MKKSILPVLMTGAAVAPLHGQLIGTENFDYVDGNIAGQTGGTGFNYDNFDKAVTTSSSNWDSLFGTPTVTGNALVTGDSGAKREYNGPIQGGGDGSNDGQDDHERSGAVRGTGRVFYRFTITRGAGTTWSGASSYDFGEERVFFGVPGGNGPSGGLEFGLSGNGNNYFTGVPADNATHTIVTVLDFTHNFIGMWLDPTAADYYDPLDGSNSTDAGGVYTPDNWSTAVRLASSSGGTTTWDDLSVALDPEEVGLKDFTDADNDGLPASWEVLHGLSDSDDGTTGESAPGAKDGPNGAAGNPDMDGVTNIVEFADGTLPNQADSDFDLLDDGEEKALGTNPLKIDSDGDTLSDYDEDRVFFTNPLLADSDGGGTADPTELALGTQPAATPGDDPLTGGNVELIGMEYFDTYTDGPATGLSDGIGWDYDNQAQVETFTGHTTLDSAWANVFGNPVIQSGVLLTQDNGVKRAFHGGPASATDTVGEATGSFRENAAASGINGSDVLYVKVNLVRQAGASWSGMSLYDFGTERIFVGVPSAPNPVSGLVEFGIEQSSNAARAFSGVTPTTGAAHTLVAKYDFAASRVDLWVNPDLGASEGTSPPLATLNVSPAQMNATGIRLASGGSGPTGWDQLVAGTTWASLSSQPSDSDGDGMPDDYEDLYEFDKNDPGDAAGDADLDGSSNLAEFTAGTNPKLVDTDGDGLSDGTGESAAGTLPLNPDTDGDGLSDGTGESAAGTSPVNPDTDGDGQSDGGEVQGHLGVTSDPLDPDDTVGGPIGLIGSDEFTYADGSIAGLAGGQHFDYENWLFNGPFIGHTSTGSDWDGTAVVAGGRLVTRDTYAFRDFNGPSEGPGSDEAPTDARMGAVNDEGTHDASVVYFKATMVRRAGAALSLIGPDDFDQERLAFGIVDNGGTPQWGIREGGAVTADGGTLPVVEGQTYTVVGKLDYGGNLLSLWIDPDLGMDEVANPAHVTRVYNGGNWASGVRVSSTGSGDTEWDSLFVANSWDRLAAEAPLPIQLGVAAVDRVAGTVSITAAGIPEGETFHLRSSIDLESFVPLAPGFDFDSTTPQPFVISVDPDVVPKVFFRAEEGPTPP